MVGTQSQAKIVKQELAERKNTKIVATVGPACSSYEKLLELAQSGVNVFRLNFSHGDHPTHLAVIENIVKLNKETNWHLSILADLQGPKLRVGKIENNALQLNAGDIVTFTDQECLGTKDKIYMSYKGFAKDVTPGEKVLLDDGKFTFEVLSTDSIGEVKMMVIYGGVLSSNKGVNLPDTKTSLPCLTEKDLVDLDFVLTQPVNWIALSFVRRAEDIRDLRQRINKVGHSALICAKIEKPEAIDNIDAIIKETNAVMVARGDLGVEFPIEKLAVIQKLIVSKCIQRARPVIVATQMMESMIQNPSPTRAEVLDVANSVLDGADAVMLSAETSVGKYPAETVQAMSRIICETEKEPAHFKRPEPNAKSNVFNNDVICLGAAKMAEDLNARAIVGFTNSGYTAFKVSSFRPHCQIYIFSNRLDMIATLGLVWGVRGYLYNKNTSTDETILETMAILEDAGKIKKGDVVVNTGSMPVYKRARTNMIKISVVE